MHRLIKISLITLAITLPYGGACSEELFNKVIFDLSDGDVPFKHTVVSSNEESSTFFHFGTDAMYFSGSYLHLYTYDKNGTTLKWKDPKPFREPNAAFIADNNIILLNVYPKSRKRILEKRVFSDYEISDSEILEEDCMRIVRGVDSLGSSHYLMWAGAESEKNSIIYSNSTNKEVVISEIGLGYRSDIAIDHEGVPHIAFDHNKGNSVYYSMRTGNGKWDSELVNSNSTQGGKSRIILDKRDKPYIAFEAKMAGDKARNVYVSTKKENHWNKAKINDEWSYLYAFEYSHLIDALMVVYRSNDELFLGVIKDSILHEIKIDDVGKLYNENVSLIMENNAVSIFYVNRIKSQFIRARIELRTLNDFLSHDRGMSLSL